MTNNCHLKNISVERQRYKTYNNDVTYNKALDHIYHLINNNSSLNSHFPVIIASYQQAFNQIPSKMMPH